MAEGEAAQEIGLQREMGVTHAYQVASNFVKWNSSRIAKVRKNKGVLGALAKNSPENIKKREEKKAAEAAALVKRVRGEVIPILDLVSRKPSHADSSWEPLDIIGVSTTDGWKMTADATGALVFLLSQAIDLSGATHLVFQIRREEGASSDVYLKLICLSGDRLFKIKSADISLDMQEVVISLTKGKGEGRVRPFAKS